MPMTTWDEIKEKRCGVCGKWASHFYGGVPLCCQCHTGGGEGLCTEEETRKAQERMEKGLQPEPPLVE